MRYTFIIFLLASLFIFVGGCNTVDKVVDNEPVNSSSDTILKEIPEEKQLEYRYKFIEATKLRLFGQTSDALEYLNDCAEIRPHAPDPYYQMSLIATQLEEYGEAVRYGRKAVQYGPENKWYRLNLANLYLQNKVPDSALVQYEYLVEKKDIREMDILFRLAQLYQKNDHYRKALEYYDKIEERVGVNQRISELKKTIYAKIGEKEKAYQEVQKLIDEFPSETTYYGMLAELYATFNEYDKAEKMYNKLFELDSTNNMGQLSMVKYYNKKGQIDKAIDTFTEKVIPNNSIDFRNKMLIFIDFLQEQDHFSQYSNRYKRALDSLNDHYPGKSEVQALYADFFLKDNDFESAADHLKTLAERSDSKYIYWDQLLSIYSYLSKFEKMYRYGKKGINEFNNRPRLYLLSGVGALQINKLDTAILLLEEGISYVENDRDMRVQFYTQLGEAYHQNGKYSQSDHYFTEVLEIDPNNKMVLNNYSYYLSLRGEKLNKALGYSQKVIRSEPNNPVYLDTYAWILYKLGKYKKARKYMERAIKYGGLEDPDIVEHYGDILFKIGQNEKAFQLWQKAKNLGNQSEQLKYKLDNKSLPPSSDEN